MRPAVPEYWRCTPADLVPDTVSEITTRRQKPLVLRIMVEQGRTRILLLSELTPRCEQIFPHRCCFQPVRQIRQQMSRARARTIVGRKYGAALASDQQRSDLFPQQCPIVYEQG